MYLAKWLFENLYLVYLICQIKFSINNQSLIEFMKSTSMAPNFPRRFWAFLFKMSLNINGRKLRIGIFLDLTHYSGGQEKRYSSSQQMAQKSPSKFSCRERLVFPLFFAFSTLPKALVVFSISGIPFGYSVCCKKLFLKFLFYITFKQWIQKFKLCLTVQRN